MSEQEGKTVQQIVNGINVTQLNETVKLVKANPELGRFQFRAHNRMVDGSHLENRIQDFYGAGQEMSHQQSFIIHADEPDMLLGTDHGPNATEILLAALASCLNTTLLYYASAHNVEVEEIEMEMTGDVDVRGFLGIDPSVRPGFQHIDIKCRVKADVSDEQINELCRLAQKYSPVYDTISRGTTINIIPERISGTEGETGRQAI